MKPLDIFNTPLEGLNLIEASAGTGKTYTLSLFALRFIIEMGYSIDEFLVVTYTRAATAELKERISLFISKASEYVRGGDCDNKEITTIVDSAIANQGRDGVESAIEGALLRSDESQIFTIHSFCGRVLSEFTFETGRDFDVETIEDQSELIREVVEDFWRGTIALLSPFHISLIETGFTLSDAQRLAQKLSNFPLLQVLYDEVSFEEVAECWQKCREIWEKDATEITALITESKGISRAANLYKQSRLESIFDGITQAFSSDIFSKEILLLASGTLDSATLKGKERPHHPFFDKVEQFSQLKQQYIGALKQRFISFIRLTLPLKKETLGVQSQDDLITALYAVLQSDRKMTLVDAVRGRYKAALVDEFQDTDRVQFDIFHSLFSESTLFMIGDPKQAIYKFRGGDIEAYLHASRMVENRYTLQTNYRSEQGLIEGFNQFFSVENPFLYESIHYEQTKAGASIQPLVRNEAPLSPVTIWHDVTPKQQWNHMAEEIVRLMTGSVYLDGGEGKQLSLSDIAILVQTNSEAQDVKKALTARGIHSVVSKSGSIFASYECQKLYLLLRLFLEPSRESLSRTVLVSRFFLYSHEEIEEQIADDVRWSEWLGSLYECREILHSKGVSQAIDAFLRTHKVYGLLLASQEGERAVTNIRHLLELLHQQELILGHEPELLLSYLSRKMQEEQSSTEYELRLESEADAVTIMTVHKSKGLQFPLVFHALTSTYKIRPNSEPIYAGPSGMVMDLRTGESETVKERCQFEEYAEGLRMFYVAATRAEYKLYLIMLKPPKAGYVELTPMGKYLDRRFDSPAIEICSAPDCGSERLLARKKTHSKKIAGFPRNRTIQQEQQVRSYTALTKGTTEHVSHPVPDNPEGIFAFPRGPRAGTALHEIFEELDFSHRGDMVGHIETTVQKVMDRYNYGNEDLAPVATMVQSVLHKDLGGFSLSNLQRQDRLTEMEFYLKAESINEKFLQNLLGTEVGHISKGSVNSYLNGFIDLLFRVGDTYFILDWKSNYLGGTPAEYGQKALSEAMLQHNYHLQYLLYTTAVVAFLEKRMPHFSYEKHFGGVYYIFLRGVEDGDSMNGIYYRKPKEEIIGVLLSHFKGEHL